MSSTSIIPGLIYLIFWILITNKPLGIQAGPLRSSNVDIGAGYSSDTQQITVQKCFNTVLSSAAQQQGTVQLDSSVSSSSLENQLGVTVSASGSYQQFSADATAHYLRTIKDKDYSMSLNYYEFSSNNIAVQLQGYGVDALTDLGKQIYNDGKNPYFLLLCGDHYVTSYQQGALLTMSINIEFNSAESKKIFKAKAGATFGSIVKASASIKSIVEENKIGGSVTIQAFQYGGEPSQLSQILNKNENGQFYALTCSLTAMDDCVRSASGLLDYAKEQFPKQFSFELNKGLAPLGIGFVQFSPIKYLGLSQPQSLVTDQIKSYRKELSYKLKENEYYLEKLHPFINNGYAVPLTSDFSSNANLLWKKAKANVDRLMQPHYGAADCFNKPDECESIKNMIMSDLEDITADDLKFLEPIKYLFTMHFKDQIMVAFNMGENSASSWSILQEPDVQKMVRVVGDDKSYEWSITFAADDILAKFKGSSSDGIHYNGKRCILMRPFPENCEDFSEMRYLSPYYFKLFDGSS